MLANRVFMPRAERKRKREMTEKRKEKRNVRSARRSRVVDKFYDALTVGEYRVRNAA
jgi:hypothetical protein